MTRRLLVLFAALALVLALFSAPVARAQGSPTAHLITGVDLHDGTVVKVDGTYYLYGTKYGCGFTWGNPATHWCGFGVSTAPSLDGPWSPVTTLVAPTDVNTWTGLTWDASCMRGGAGCFNPRMVQRGDGVWILWFNSPADFAATGANAYYAMGCNSPTGPCGPGHPPYGGLYKPALYLCGQNGDFSIIPDGTGSAYIACTQANQTIRIEKLDQWWVNGTNQGVVTVAGFDQSEAPGAYWDPTISRWVMTLNYRNCGYGAGCGLAYATAPSLLGPWSSPTTAGVTTDVHSRAVISANSCGGQPRTVTVLDGTPYQVIDLWDGAMNQTSAPVLITPLVANDLNTLRPWRPFHEIACTGGS